MLLAHVGPQGRNGAPRIAQDRTGSPRIAQDRPGSPRIAQDRTGSPGIAQDRPGSHRIAQGRSDSYRIAQDRSGSRRIAQDRPGSSEIVQDCPGSPERAQLACLGAIASSLPPGPFLGAFQSPCSRSDPRIVQIDHLGRFSSIDLAGSQNIGNPWSLEPQAAGQGATREAHRNKRRKGSQRVD